jgi:mannitol-specific phosphotransferase system IIBC component
VTQAHKIGIALAICLAIAITAVVATYLVMSAQQRVAVAEAQTTIEKARAETAQQAARDALSEVTKRDDELAARTKASERVIVKTSASPTASAAALGDIAHLPTPVKEEVKPDGSHVFNLTPESVVSLYQNVARCEVTRDSLQTCLADKTSLANANDHNIEAAMAWERSAEDWEVAANGGSKTKRFFSGLTKLGIGSLAGIALVCGTGHCK